MADGVTAGKDEARLATAESSAGQDSTSRFHERKTMPPTHLPLVIRLGGIRSLLSFCAIMTAGLAAALSPVAVAVWAPSLAALTLLPALLGAGGVGYYLWRGLSARRMFEQALRHYAQVTDDYEATELHARLIPEGETRGAHVMAHYRWFRDEYESLTRFWQDLGSPRGTQWFEPGVIQRVREIKRRSAALESTDDVIASNAAFLSLSSNWERLWREEQQPILHELDLLLSQCQWIDSRAFTPHGTVEVRELVRAHHQRLSEMTAELSAGLLQPSAALDELAWMAADARRAARSLSLRAAGAEPSLSSLASLDVEASTRPGTYALLDVVGPGRNAGYWNPVSPGAEGRAIVPVGYAGPRRLLNAGTGYLGDGTFPGC